MRRLIDTVACVYFVCFVSMLAIMCRLHVSFSIMIVIAAQTPSQVPLPVCFGVIGNIHWRFLAHLRLLRDGNGVQFHTSLVMLLAAFLCHRFFYQGSCVFQT